jgi:hypothetical protein
LKSVKEIKRIHSTIPNNTMVEMDLKIRLTIQFLEKNNLYLAYDNNFVI